MCANPQTIDRERVTDKQITMGDINWFLPARRSKRGLCYGNVPVRLSVGPSQPVLYQLS